MRFGEQRKQLFFTAFLIQRLNKEFSRSRSWNRVGQTLTLISENKKTASRNRIFQGIYNFLRLSCTFHALSQKKHWWERMPLNQKQKNESRNRVKYARTQLSFSCVSNARTHKKSIIWLLCTLFYQFPILFINETWIQLSAYLILQKRKSRPKKRSMK